MNKMPNKNISNLSKPYTIDEIRNENIYYNSPREVGLKKALKLYSKELENINLNDKNELELGDYNHKVIVPNIKSYSKRFKKFRNSIGLTQKEMAVIVNTTQQSIYQIENGNAIPSVVWIINMIIYFDLNAHWFLTGEASMYTSRDFLEERFNELSKEKNNLQKEINRKNKMIDHLMQCNN